MVHKNLMTVWPEIRCQRGHDKHETLGKFVDLTQPHQYRDYPQVPESMAVQFEMSVWDPERYPVDGGPYCPAHDAVSATILSHGIWEPRETILALHAFQTADPDSVFVDMGAQMGWFSLLAQANGLDVRAWECDPDNNDLLWRNWDLNSDGLDRGLETSNERIGPESTAAEMLPVVPICLAKLDLEGAERDAVRMLWPSIEVGLVDHMLIEISPVFDTYYGDLVLELREYFDIYMLPDRGQALDGSFDGSPLSMAQWRLGSGVPGSVLHGEVNSWHQEDLWFVRRP